MKFKLSPIKFPPSSPFFFPISSLWKLQLNQTNHYFWSPFPTSCPISVFIHKKKNIFTSDNRDDFHDDSFLGHHDPFLSKQNQRDQNHHQLSLFNLPTPYHLPCFAVDHFDYFTRRLGQNPHPDLDLILFQQQQQGEVALDFAIGGEGNEKGAAVEVKRVAVASRKRSKKDRHSKITTARGTRDRRMRLSLEVAREFFDLQDMLGFDKASKTVEWLISQSNSAIKEITRKVRGSDGIAASFASGCEIRFDGDNGGRTVESSSGRKWSKEWKAGQSRRRDAHRRSSSATRESRMKARKRARERTLENMWKRSLEGSILNNPTKTCSSPHEAGEESSCIQDQTATTGSNLEILTQYEEIAGMEGRIRIDFSSSDLVSGKWSPAEASSSNLNLQELGIPRSKQLRNCEQFFKQWEANYNYGFDHS